MLLIPFYLFEYNYKLSISASVQCKSKRNSTTLDETSASVLANIGCQTFEILFQAKFFIVLLCRQTMLVNPKIYNFLLAKCL